MKKLKVLYEWPLSKVELIEIDGEKFILKTIHKNFVDEVYRQRYLQKKCKKINIPKIKKFERESKTISFLMEYIPGRAKVNLRDSLRLINNFHLETTGVRPKCFPKYGFDEFYGNFQKIKKSIPGEFASFNKKELKKTFGGVFNSKKSIVHGDWGRDQILFHKKFYIIDFGKSFYGPSILDYAYLFLRSKKINKKVLGLVGGREIFMKVRIVSCIIILSWFELCKRKYIKHDFKKEISEYVNLFELNLKVLK